MIAGGLATTLLCCAVVAGAGDETRASVEARKKDLLAEIAALQRLIDAVGDPADADRKRDEARREARLKTLGEIEVKLARLVDTKTEVSVAGVPAGNSNAEVNAADLETKSNVAKLPAHLREAVKLAEQATKPVTDYHAFFHTGLRMLAPYHVTGASTVDNSSTTTGGYLEFIYTDVWAWRPKRVVAAKTSSARKQAFDNEIKRGKSLTDAATAADAAEKLALERDLPQPWLSAISDWSGGWDFTTRLAFNFGGGDAPSASAIAGAGDFNAEIAIDKHIVRGWVGGNAYCFNLGGTVGATTDKASLRVHPRYVYGPSFNLAFDDPLPSESAQPRKALFNVRAGWAYVDSARFLHGAGVPPLTLRTISPGIPRFSLAKGSALEAEMFYPFGLQSFVTFGARAYRVSDDSLSPWSIYIGITTPFSKAAGALFPK